MGGRTPVALSGHFPSGIHPCSDNRGDVGVKGGRLEVGQADPAAGPASVHKVRGVGHLPLRLA